MNISAIVVVFPLGLETLPPLVKEHQLLVLIPLSVLLLSVRNGCFSQVVNAAGINVASAYHFLS